MHDPLPIPANLLRYVGRQVASDVVRLLVALAAIALPLILWAALPIASSGQSSKADELSKLQQRIDRARGQIGRKRGTERVLSSEIARYSRRLDRLEGKITTLGARQARVQTDLDDRRGELERLRTLLRDARARLVRLRSRLAETRTALRDRLIQIYKAPKPDLVSVVLNSDGFVDLLERGEFIKRISDQDRKIVGIVRGARADAERSQRRLGRLERRQTTVTEIVKRRRDAVSAIRMQLVGTRVGYRRTKQGKAAALGRVRDQRVQLESNVDELEAASRRIRDQLQAAQRRNNAGGPGVPPIRRGTGRFIFPVNGPMTSAVRSALGPTACRHRYSGAGRHSDSCCRLGHGGAAAGCGGIGRLWELHVHPAQRHDVVVLRTSVAAGHDSGSEREPGPGHRVRREHWELVRGAPAFRGAGQRHSRRPDGLPVSAAAVATGPARPLGRSPDADDCTASRPWRTAGGNQC